MFWWIGISCVAWTGIELLRLASATPRAAQPLASERPARRPWGQTGRRFAAWDQEGRRVVVEDLGRY